MTDDKQKSAFSDQEEQDEVVVMTDDQGQEHLFRLDLAFPVETKTYAVLVPLDPETGEDAASGPEDDGEEGEAFIVQMEFDEEGEESFLIPEEEEFQEALQAYEKLFAGEETES